MKDQEGPEMWMHSYCASRRLMKVGSAIRLKLFISTQEPVLQASLSCNCSQLKKNEHSLSYKINVPVLPFFPLLSYENGVSFFFFFFVSLFLKKCFRHSTFNPSIDLTVVLSNMLPQFSNSISLIIAPNATQLHPKQAAD